MENNELQKIWKNLDKEVSPFSVEELNVLLISKTRQTMGNYVRMEIFSVLVSLGFIVFLIVASYNRRTDMLYLINNLIVGIITLIALVSGLYAWKKLKLGKLDQPLKKWLEERIALLSKWLTGRFSRFTLYILPFISILTILSIHVFYERKDLIDVLNNQESVSGLVAGLLVGLAVGYYFVYKIRKNQIRNLDFLKDLHNRLCQIS